MKITDIKTAVLEGFCDWLLIRVDTDEGISGYGEAWAPWMSDKVKPLVLAMGSVLKGEDPRDVERLYMKMGPSSRDALAMYAISGIEMALWDVTGKAIGVPVYRLLGGKFRDRVKVYADLHAGEAVTSARSYSVEERENYTPEAYGRNARRAVDRGFTHIKFDLYPNIATLVGPEGIQGGYQTLYGPMGGRLSNPAVDFMASLIQGAREAVGYDVDIAVDCYQYPLESAIRLANALEPFRLIWIEDAVSLDDLDAVAAFTASIKTPTLTGEMLHTLAGFKTLFEKHAVRAIAPDPSVCGGLSQGKKIADLAYIYGMPVAPHNILSPVGTIAVVHACATMINLVALEFHSFGIPWWNDLLKGGIIIEDGYIRVPEKPGLGVELDEKVARKHLKEGESLFD